MFNELASLAVHNLTRARARLFMTAGGVLVGTTAVILLIALTIGLQTAAEAGIGANASLTEIRVYPNFGYFPGGEPTDAAELPELDIASVQALWTIPGVAAVIPVVELQTWGELIAGDYRGGGQILGIDPALLSYLGVQPQQGDLTLQGDQIIVGSFIGQNFYDPTSEVYQPITLDLFTTELELNIYKNDGTDNREIDIAVSSVLAPGNSYDYSILMPAQRVIELNEFATGQPLDPETFRFNQVIVRASSRETVNQVTDAIRELGYSAGGIGDYLDVLNNFFGTMRVVLGGVGGVALLVAAFGVANTMTMAILERTREIGLMKAVGATDRDVLTVFLIEAGLVGLCGGIAGVLLSYGLQNLINSAVANIQPDQGGGVAFLPVDVTQLGGRLMIIPPELAVFALALATGVGIAAGLFPSLRAARMTTVVALKTE